MDQLGISNTVDRTDAFSVARVATPDVSSCSGFGVCYVRRPLRKLATKIFDLSVNLDVCLNVFQHRKQGLSFAIYEYKRVLCCIIYCASFLSFQFPWNI